MKTSINHDKGLNFLLVNCNAIQESEDTSLGSKVNKSFENSLTTHTNIKLDHAGEKNTRKAFNKAKYWNGELRHLHSQKTRQSTRYIKSPT